MKKTTTIAITIKTPKTIEDRFSAPDGSGSPQWGQDLALADTNFRQERHEIIFDIV
jgi:hypothetical protein